MSTMEAIPLDEAQSADAAKALALAFQHDPLFSYVIPNPDERARQLPEFFAINLRFGHLYGKVFTTPGTPEGAAIWMPPDADVTPERAKSAGFDRFPTLLGTEAWQRLGKILEYLETQHHSQLPPESWFLMAVGVTPTRQGQGIGSALMQAGMKQAADAGLPCFLDTALPQNLAFYQKLGFHVLVETTEPESDLTFWTFRRDAP